MKLCEKSILTRCNFSLFQKRLLDTAPQQYQVDPFAYNTNPAPVPMSSPAYNTSPAPVPMSSPAYNTSPSPFPVPSPADNKMYTAPVDEFAPRQPTYSDISDQVSMSTSNQLVFVYIEISSSCFSVMKILLNYSSPQNQTSPTAAPANTIAQGNPFNQIVSSKF